MKRYFLLCCAVCLALNGFGESVYTFDLKKDLIIGPASLGLAVSSLFIDHGAANASRDAVPRRSDVNAFDRGLMFPYSPSLDLAGDIAIYLPIAMPLLSLVKNFRDGNAWLSYGIMYAESVLLVVGTTGIFKNFVVRYRPYAYFEDMPSREKTDYHKSFPSRHTALAFMSAGFFTSTFSAEYPDSPWKIPLGALAYTLASGVGASRIFSGSHFLTDVLSGAAIGSVYGYLVPRLHLRKNSKNITLTPLANGILISLNP